MASSTHQSPGTVWILLASISVILQGCGGAPRDANEVVTVPMNAAAEPAQAAPLPLPLPVLTRRDLIVAAARVTDAVASGAPIAPENAALTGRRFALRLPFGCGGPTPDEAGPWAGWSRNTESGALKISARSELSAQDPWIRAVAGTTEFEAAEGFWLRRPWTSAESCPPSPDATVGEGDTETLALLQLFAADAPRTRQRGNRPYTSTVKTSDDEAPRAFRLLLEGRVAGFADREPVHCTQSAPDSRPRCAVAVEFTRIAFEDDLGDIIAEWRY